MEVDRGYMILAHIAFYLRTVDGQDEQQTPNIGLRQRSVPESKAGSVHAQPTERLPLRFAYGAVHLVNKHTLH